MSSSAASRVASAAFGHLGVSPFSQAVRLLDGTSDACRQFSLGNQLDAVGGVANEQGGVSVD